MYTLRTLRATLGAGPLAQLADLRGEVLVAAAQAHRLTGRTPAAAGLLVEAARHLGAGSGDALTKAALLMEWGRRWQSQRRYAVAAGAFRQVEHIYRHIRDPHLAAKALVARADSLGDVHPLLGVRLQRRAIRELDGDRDRDLEMVAHHLLAWCLNDAGHSDEARGNLRTTSWRPGRRQLLTLAILACLALCLVVRWNTSPSLPRGLYLELPRWLVRRPPARGDLVVACAPAAGAVLARRRGYLAEGACDAAAAGGAAPLGKIVLAVAGDLVDESPAGLAANGVPEPASLFAGRHAGAPPAALAIRPPAPGRRAALAVRPLPSALVPQPLLRPGTSQRRARATWSPSSSWKTPALPAFACAAAAGPPRPSGPGARGRPVRRSARRPRAGGAGNMRGAMSTHGCALAARSQSPSNIAGTQSAAGQRLQVPSMKTRGRPSSRRLAFPISRTNSACRGNEQPPSCPASVA